MALLIAGTVLVVMGLLAGALLVAAPLGVVGTSGDFTLWLLFPLLSVAGFALFVVGAKTAHIRGLSIALSGALLLLAVVAAGGLMLHATSFLRNESGTLSLWYVMVVAGILGAVGAASRSGQLDAG